MQSADRAYPTLHSLRTFKSKALFDLNMKDIDLDWNNVVIESSENRQKLIDYGTFRKSMVDQILDYALRKAKCKDVCILQAVGSTNPTSDYDISISGPKSAEVVAEFASTFSELFGKTSDQVFDTNLYGSAFYEPVSSDTEYDLVFSLFPHNDGDRIKYIKYICLSKEDIGVVEDQRAWAYVKLIKTLDNTKYIESLRELNNPQIHQAFELLKLLKNDENINSYPGKLKSVTVELDNLILTARQGKNVSDAKRRYQNALSTANYYASEAYYTRGAFFHIVGHNQTQLIQLPISSAEYIDSYIENIAGLIEVMIKHNKREEKNCKNMIIDLSKYYYRAIDALVNLIKLTSNDKRVINHLNRLRNSSHRVKTTLRGKTVCDSSETKECVKPKVSEDLYIDFLDLVEINCDDPISDIFATFIANIKVI